MNYTPDNIKSLQPNEIFVFGSNEAGIHGAGAANLAFKKFGAIWGQGDGLQGQTYGISTKNRKIQTLPLHRIVPKVARFVRFATQNPGYTFLVTKIGCGLAGYNVKDIAPIFFINVLPPNVIMPEEFWRYSKTESV